MAEKTVLVSGGSGFLGGWCVIELLQRGYRVRTTVRDLAREPDVRETVGSQVDPGDRLTVLAANLSSDDGWADAAAGCDYVLHVASPFPPNQPKDPDELIVPAREGTLRVLRAALDGGAERVVVTSSVAAIGADRGAPDRALTEDDWTDTENPSVSPYAKSKTLAERAAWDFVRERGEEQKLATINPGAILGPVLNKDTSYSIEMVQRLMRGMPGTPRIGFSCVDVRDVADLEIKAMVAPEAGGKRFIAVDEWQWMSDVADTLRERLGPDAKKVPHRTVPDFLVRAMAIFDGGIRPLTSQLGKKQEFSNAQAKAVLGWSPRPVDVTVADCGRSLLAVGAL
jgi:nucleoside-diphosphate-sugar epimerase